MGGDDHAGTTIVGHEFNLTRRQHHVDRVNHRTGFKSTVVADNPFPTVAGVERDAITGFNA